MTKPEKPASSQMILLPPPIMTAGSCFCLAQARASATSARAVTSTKWAAGPPRPMVEYAARETLSEIRMSLKLYQLLALRTAQGLL